MTRAARDASAGAAAERLFQEEVRSHLRRNYLSHLAHGLLGQTGMRLLNAPTFVPLYISSLAGFDAAVGIARGLQYLGMFLSPILGATIIEHRRRVLPVGFLIGGLMRVQILGLALGGLLLPAPWALAGAFLVLTLFGFFLGIQGVVFNFLVSKVIPVARRGTLMGLRNALSGITATIVAIYAGRRLLAYDALGNGYAATFLLAFGLTSLGLLALLAVREPRTPEVRAPSRVGQRLRELPALLRSDRAFTHYFVARALATMGRMSVPFYALFAKARLEMTGERIGILTGAFVLTQSVGNLVWGLVADRTGFRAVFLAALGLWMFAVLLLLHSEGFPMLVVVFAALGAGLGGFQMSAQNLVLEFGSRHDLPMRIAVANSASELVASFGAILGGAIASFFSFPTVFWTGLAFQAGGIALVLWRVDEPRHRTGSPERRRLPGSDARD